MHPMFKELFIQTDADDLPAGQDRRRRGRRSRRARPARQRRRPAPGAPPLTASAGPRPEHRGHHDRPGTAAPAMSRPRAGR